MKQALIQQAVRTATGNQDWTDSSVVGDMAAAIFFGSNAIANDTTTADSGLIVGATGLLSNAAVNLAGLTDGLVSSASRRYVTNANAIARSTVAGVVDLLAAAVTPIVNGVTMNYSTVSAVAYLMNALMLSGSDIEVQTSSSSFASGDTVKTVTHGLTGLPDIIIMFANRNITAIPGTGASVSNIGFLERQGGSDGGYGWTLASGVDPPAATAMMTNDLGHQASGGVDNYTYSISNVTASTFDINRSVSGAVVDSQVFIALRGKDRPFFAQAGAFLTPTATGVSTPISGMAGAPEVLMLVGTRRTNVGSLSVNDTAGAGGFGVAVNNNGTTQQMAAATQVQQAITPPVAKCRTTVSKALLILSDTGTPLVDATVSSWNNDGVSLNYSTVDASARAVAYLAFGKAEVGPLLSARGIIALQ